MTAVPTILCISACLACGFAGAEETSAPSDTRPTSAQSDRQRILADWAAREAILRSGELQWRIDRHNRSATFGTAPAPEDSPRLYTAFDGDSFRLDGRSVPSARLGSLTHVTSTLSSPLGSELKGRGYVEALQSRFVQQETLEPSQPYTAILDPRRASHFWTSEGQAWPRALVAAADTPDRHTDAASVLGGIVPLEFGLLDALRLAIRPAACAGDPDGAENFRILSDRPVVEGRACLVIENLFDAHGQASHRVWIDASRSSVIVRCILSGPDELLRQYDIEYDRPDAGAWLPAKLTVLQMNNLGDPYDQIVATRHSAVLNAELPEATFPTDFPAGTLVTDYVAGEQYLVRRDGTRRTVSVSETLAGLTYADLWSEHSDPAPLSLDERRFRNALRRTVLKFVTWPGILVTLAGAYVVCLFGRAGLRRLRRAGSRTGTGSPSELSELSRSAVSPDREHAS